MDPYKLSVVKGARCLPKRIEVLCNLIEKITNWIEGV